MFFKIPLFGCLGNTWSHKVEFASPECSNQIDILGLQLNICSWLATGGELADHNLDNHVSCNQTENLKRAFRYENRTLLTEVVTVFLPVCLTFRGLALVHGDQMRNNVRSRRGRHHLRPGDRDQDDITHRSTVTPPCLQGKQLFAALIMFYILPLNEDKRSPSFMIKYMTSLC